MIEGGLRQNWSFQSVVAGNITEQQHRSHASAVRCWLMLTCFDQRIALENYGQECWLLICDVEADTDPIRLVRLAEPN